MEEKEQKREYKKKTKKRGRHRVSVVCGCKIEYFIFI